MKPKIGGLKFGIRKVAADNIYVSPAWRGRKMCRAFMREWRICRLEGKAIQPLSEL